ncbi:tetratricopeptide repeat protein [Desulfovermiculus halophilus]|uniref:tetratricopeptide repeat protein n=1 Tax=Desulfovermiculus halophilus TaxID=339722 RepID=UPI00048A0330|nr:tetratricopeptide repeat protein [Desulfovermiculus halophilus]
MRFLYPPILLACLLIGLGAGLSGCSASGTSPSRSPVAPAPSLSKQARATHAYLRYLQQSGSQALQALNTAIELDPAPELYLEKIRYLWRRKDYAQAAETAREGLRRTPDHPGLTLALIRTLWTQDSDSQAADLVERLLQEHPKDWSLRSHLANYLLQQGQPSRALDVLHSIPDQARTANMHYLLAQAHESLDNREQTITHLERATELNPSFRKAWAELGYQYELSRDLVAAQQAYTTLLDLGEDSSKILLRLVEIHLKLNDPNQAVNLLLNRSRSGQTLLPGVGLFVHNGFYSQAASVLEQAPPEAGSSPRGLLYKAVLALELDNAPDQALHFLGNIPAASDIYPRALALRAQLLWEQGSTQAALELTKQGQKEYPDLAVFYSLHARILREQNQLTQARETLVRGLRAIPDDPELLFQLGVVDYELDEIPKAMAHMEAIISQDPEHAQALNFLGYTLVEQGQSLDRARILIEKALALDSENGYYLDSLAWYQYTVGQNEKAWESIQNAVALVADDPVIWEHYADIARAVHELKQARRGYRKALALNPEHPQRLRNKLQAVDKHNDPETQ